MDRKAGSWKKSYCLAYTVVFILLCGLVYNYFIRYGKSFIFSDDGWMQHFKALTYYAKWMRSILRELLEHHRLVIPKFSFSIGYGSDIVTTLHYYAIGDPLNVFAVLVPGRYMADFYGILV